MMIKMIKMLAFHCYNSKRPFSNMNSQTNVNVAFGYFFIASLFWVIHSCKNHWGTGKLLFLS